MNEQQTDTPVESNPTIPSSGGVRLRVWILAVVIVLALAGGAYLAKSYPEALGTGNGDNASKELPADLIAKLEMMDKRLQQMEEKERAALDAAQEDGTLQDTKIVPDAKDLAKLKEGLATLSSALALVKDEIKKATQSTESERANTQTGMASIMAFIQLQKAILSGLPFEEERATMRKTVGQDDTMVDALAKLEPFASSGVASLHALHRQWDQSSVSAKKALLESGARTWFDRIVVALEGLVSIKSLNNPADASLSINAVSTDLEQGKLTAALEKVAALPQAVQLVVADWKAKATVRAEVDALLDVITKRFIERGLMPESEPAKEEAKP